MKLVILFCLVAAAYAAPEQRITYSKDNVQILRYETDNIGDGNYKFGFEQTDGTRQDQEGQVLNEGQEDESIVMRGSYAWVGPDGVTYTVNYIADENGFQPTIQQGPGGLIPDSVVAAFNG